MRVRGARSREFPGGSRGYPGLPGTTRTTPGDHQNPYLIFPGIFPVFLFSDDFQPVLAMKFLVESEFQGQEPPRTQETTKTTGTIRIPRVGFGTDRPYIALFWGRPSGDLPICSYLRNTVET